MDESNKVELDRCRVDNNLVTCNCGTRHCNGNADIIGKLLATAQDSWRLPKGCDMPIHGIKPIFDIWRNGTIRPSVTCIDSSSNELVSYGDFCVIEVPVIPETCFVTGTPVLTSRNITEELIEDGLAVSGGAHNPNCKKELTASLGPALDANNTDLEPTTTMTREPLEITTIVLPPIISTRNLTSFQYAMAFIIDASWLVKTNNGSLRAMLSFVEDAVSLLQPKDAVYIGAYGGEDNDTKQGQTFCNRLENCTFQESSYASTQFTTNLFKNDNKPTARVFIHIGTGILTVARDLEYTSAQIENLKAQRVHLINIAPKWGNTERMRAWSTNPNTDYFEVKDLDVKSLNLDLAKKIIQVACN